MGKTKSVAVVSLESAAAEFETQLAEMGMTLEDFTRRYIEPWAKAEMERETQWKS